MARTMVTTYTCDACGNEVARPRDLVPYVLQRRKGEWPEAKTDLCESCVVKLFEMARKFFNDLSEFVLSEFVE